jgi:hypothetical protein
VTYDYLQPYIDDATEVIKEALRDYVGDGDGIDEAILNAHDRAVRNALLEDLRAEVTAWEPYYTYDIGEAFPADSVVDLISDRFEETL